MLRITAVTMAFISVAACATRAPVVEKTPIENVDRFLAGRLEYLPHTSGTDASFSGESAQALSMIGRSDLIPKSLTVCRPVESVDDAKAHILRAASQSPVVFLNEAHDAPHHRAFLTDLLAGLANRGFNTLAGETFSNFPDTKLNAVDDSPDFYLSSEFGAFTNEPVYAAAVTEAHRHGFKLVAYEFVSDFASTEPMSQMNEREAGQFANLKAKLPDLEREKLLAFVGYGHALEHPFGDETMVFKSLASRFKTELDLDPLTIDQTMCTVDGSEPRIVHPPDPEAAGLYDIFMGHPRETYSRSRPNWRFTDRSKPIAIPSKLYPESGWTIIESRRAGAPLESVPHDRVGVRRGDYDVIVFVPKGAYHISYFAWPAPAQPN